MKSNKTKYLLIFFMKIKQKIFREIAYLTVLNFFPVQKWFFDHFRNPVKKDKLVKLSFNEYLMTQNRCGIFS